MSEQDWTGVRAVELDGDANVTRSIVGLLRARDLQLHESGAGLAAVGGDLSIENGGCGPVIANGSVTIRNGGCGPLVANGDVDIDNGGCGTLVAAGGARIGRGGIAGIVLSPDVTVEDGARVVVSSPLALGLGVGIGFVAALLSRRSRR
jgi:hypothetical protein